MNTPNRIRRRYINSVIGLFFAYLIVIPTVLYLLEPQRLVNEIADSLIMFILKVSMIALVISLLIANWIKSDPEFEE